MHHPLRAAAVQFHHAPGDKAANLVTLAAIVDAAAKRDVRLIVFPEMCLTGYWHVRHLAAEDVEALAETVPSGPSCRRLLALARQYKMSIGAGLIERDDDGALYNSYVVAMPDGRVACHRKIHMFISPHLQAGNA